jgi:hypothetical protein
MLKLQHRVNVRSIHDTIKIINSVRNTVFSLQKSFLQQRYEQIYQGAKSGTMVATGETRSKLFNTVKTSSSNYAHFICGYLPTTNNQSFEQEFGSRGNVHHGKKEHFGRDGEPKCSRNPNDLYSSLGSQYMSNRSARRRALALSIDRALQTRTGSAMGGSSAIQYRPDLSNLVHKMRIITRAVTRLA